MRVSAGVGSNVIALFNCNSSSVSGDLEYGIQTLWSTFIPTLWTTCNNNPAWFSPSTGKSLFTAKDPGDAKALWEEYSDTGSRTHIIKLTMACSTDKTLEAGAAVAGEKNNFNAPMALSEGLVDFSVRKELNNGAWYIKNRDAVRTFDMTVRETRAGNYFTLMRTVLQGAGAGPLAWNLIDNSTTYNWVVLALVGARTGSQHRLPADALITLNLTEVK